MKNWSTGISEQLVRWHCVSNCTQSEVARCLYSWAIHLQIMFQGWDMYSWNRQTWTLREWECLSDTRNALVSVMIRQIFGEWALPFEFTSNIHNHSLFALLVTTSDYDIHLQSHRLISCADLSFSTNCCRETLVIQPNKEHTLLILLHKLRKLGTLTTILASDFYETTLMRHSSRFEMNSSNLLDVKEILGACGMKNISDPSVNRQKICFDHELWVNSVNHKVILEVSASIFRNFYKCILIFGQPYLMSLLPCVPDM